MPVIPVIARLAAIALPAFACLTLSVPAQALVVTCTSSFVDVPGDASYCQAAQWLKARNITLGCTDATHFCPNDPVTRASMALFLNRLGNVATPEFLHNANVFSNSGSIVACQAGPFAVSGYNRSATGAASTYLYGGSGQVGYTRLVYSYDGGMNWNYWASYYIPVTVPASGYVAASSTAQPLVLGVGASVTFGVMLTASTGTLSGGCEMTVRIDNSNAVILE